MLAKTTLTWTFRWVIRHGWNIYITVNIREWYMIALCEQWNNRYLIALLKVLVCNLLFHKMNCFSTISTRMMSHKCKGVPYPSTKIHTLSWIILNILSLGYSKIEHDKNQLKVEGSTSRLKEYICKTILQIHTVSSSYTRLYMTQLACDETYNSLSFYIPLIRTKNKKCWSNNSRIKLKKKTPN